jgi:hypothetical protein
VTYTGELVDGLPRYSCCLRYVWDLPRAAIAGRLVAVPSGPLDVGLDLALLAARSNDRRLT